MTSKIAKPFIVALLFSVSIGFLHYFYILNFGQSFFKSFDYIFFDFKQKLFLDPKSQEEKITIVEIDESSLIELGRWPWPRKQIAELIEKIIEKGAETIVLDIVFSEASDETNDAALARVIEKYSDKIILGSYINSYAVTNSRDEKKCLQDFIFTKKNSKTTELWSQTKNYKSKHTHDFDRLYQENLNHYLSEKISSTIFDLNDSELFYLTNEHAKLIMEYCRQLRSGTDSIFFKRQTPSNIILNIDALQDVASYTGAFSVMPDTDGAIRRYYSEYKIAELSIPSSAGVKYLNQSPPHFFWINFTQKTPLKITASKLLRSPDINLNGQVVLLGITSPGVYDIRKTPIHEALPGTFILAQAASNLKNKNYLTYWQHSYLLFVLLAAVLCLLLLFNNSLRWAHSVGTFIAALLTILIIEYSLFVNNLFFWSFDFYLLWSIFFVINNYLFYKKEAAQKNFIRTTFSKYVSENVVNDILNSPDKINLSGEKKNLTILFSDIRNFTSMSENLDPIVISDFLNTYFDPMVETIKKNNGTVDKFIGDGLMAFFGAPIANKNNSQNACMSALQCIQNLEEINIKISRTIKTNISVGIGLNQQEVFVGNIGANNLQSYTVIGDGVNLAARLQALTKKYAVQIIVSESVYRSCHQHFSFRKLDLVKVKGRLEQIWIYELRSSSGLADNNYVAAYEALLADFFNKNLKEARNKINQLLQLYPNDTPISILHARLLEIEKNPVANWESFKFGSS